MRRRPIRNNRQWLQVVFALAVLSEAWTKDYIVTRTDLIVFTVIAVVFALVALDARRAARFVIWANWFMAPPHFKPSAAQLEFLRIGASFIAALLGFKIILHLL